MPSDKDTKTVNLEKEQIEKIEELNREHPYLQKRGFSWITRFLINIGLKEVEEGEEDEREGR